MKKKLKIAIIFDQTVKAGGGYCQSLNALNVINNLPKNTFDINIFVIDKETKKFLKSRKYNVRHLNLSLIHKFLLIIKTNPRFQFLFLFIKMFSSFNILEKKMIKENIDLVYFLSPSKLILDIGSLNFVYTVWDNCHRDYPEFPEVREYNQFQIRELCLSYLKKAFAVLVDSELGKINLCKRYNLDANRVFIMPFEPSNITNKEWSNAIYLEKYLDYKPYIFYPAQYWPHKNHSYIIRSIKILETRFKINIQAVFTGYDKGNLSYLKKLSDELLIRKKIHFLDFLTDLEISYLYKNCFALVMPTYFGPTNIPPLEAFHYEVPLLYSDLEGMREQVKNAALFIDLEDPNSLSESIYNLYKDESIKEKLLKNGKKLLKENKKLNRERILIAIFKKFQAIRRSWK